MVVLILCRARTCAPTGCNLIGCAAHGFGAGGNTVLKTLYYEQILSFLEKKRLCCWPILLSRVYTCYWGQPDVAGGPEENYGRIPSTVTVCHVKAPGLKRPPCWWERIESWLAAPAVFAPMCQCGHCKTRRCCWTHLTVCWTPSSLLNSNTHSPWAVLTHNCVYTSLLLCIVPSLPAKPQLMWPVLFVPVFWTVTTLLTRLHLGQLR